LFFQNPEVLKKRVPFLLAILFSPVLLLASHGMEEEEEEASAAAQQGLHIYPNPATDKVYITHPHGTMEQAEVYNLLGEKVITQAGASGQNRITIDISGLPAGMYVVTALRKGYRISGKLVVQKEE
jgi:hypothetical protein